MNAANPTTSTNGSGSDNSMTNSERNRSFRKGLQREALTNALSGQSTMNYQAIMDGFTAKGIPLADIQPRLNIFTYTAWGWMGRTVRKGERGVKVCTFVPYRVRDKDTGDPKTVSMPRQTTVFHISQTELVAEQQAIRPEAGHE